MPVDLEIVSPERLLLSKPVDMVVIPAAEGEMGVLPNHAPMIVLLRGGTIRLYEGAKVVEQLFVTGGFAEVTTTRVTVLANEATPVADTVRGFKAIVAGEYDHLPEAAFYMVGTIEDAVKKAESMKAAV